MKHFVPAVTVLALTTFLSAAVVCAAEPTVAELKEPPAGLSSEVAAAISPTGYRISNDKGPVCDVWLAKEVPLKADFKPSLRVKYPLQTGELVGVIRFPESNKPADFRGQELKPGTYTLRYGLQPDDGNHLGTSETRDFLVGSRPSDDKDPRRIEDLKAVFKLSTGASGTTHPTIFLLIPTEKPFGAAAAKMDERHFLILNANLNGKDQAKLVPVPLSVVVVGVGEG